MLGFYLLWRHQLQGVWYPNVLFRLHLKNKGRIIVASGSGSSQPLVVTSPLKTSPGTSNFKQNQQHEARITITQHVPVHGITNPGDDAVDIGFSNKLSSKPRSAEAAVNNFWGVNSSSANAEIICEPDFYW
ncbi:hypothetical protein C5167_031245 [Papaver somniferum]|nr:hypothetical protein C5167_031245 [Papaver somniferum]